MIVVMGVSGSGKTTVGRLLARSLGAEFIEGDDLHPPENVAKMASGTPLEDADRWGWLDTIGARARAVQETGRPVVVTCSALRRAYRERLSAAMGARPRFVFLRGDFELLNARMSARRDHFMPPGLLRSQLATLEEPDRDEGAIALDVTSPPHDLALRAIAALRLQPPDEQGVELG
jgi:carbohydrate kinase (thermoresistant glucokinase family)